MKIIYYIVRAILGLMAVLLYVMPVVLTLLRATDDMLLIFSYIICWPTGLSTAIVHDAIYFVEKDCDDD